MANEICYWDEVEKKQKTRDATPDELAEIAARIASAATPQIPQSVTRKAARLALLNAGKFHMVQTAIASMDDPDRTRTQIEWDDSTSFERANPTVVLLGGAIGLTSADLDQLFIAAGALQ